MNPFDHFMACGWREGRDPSRSFSTLLYKDSRLGDGQADVNPLVHYSKLSREVRAQIDTSFAADALEIQRSVIKDYFDEDYYLAKNNLKFIKDPLSHYLLTGWRQGYEPNPHFSSQNHVNRHGHIIYSGLCPFYHYVSTHQLADEGPPLVKVSRASGRPQAKSPLDLHLVMHTMRDAFDPAFYLAQYADVRDAGIDPLRHYALHGWKEGRNPSEVFWSTFYLDTYREAIGDDPNPLYHYVTKGQALGLRPNPFGAALWPQATAPGEAEWDAVVPAAEIEASDVVVVIPVYKGYDETLRAVHAALTPQAARFAVLVVNDRGPDPELNEALGRLAARGLFRYEENPANLGFVGSVNRALGLCRGKDVILLNSDAIPFGDWIDRMLWHAAAHPDAATITPFSNNATICSYPRFNQNNRVQLEASLAEIDRYASACNARASSEIPTGVGFCFYMRGAVIDEIGAFDEATFGRGYGEENDFCLRAAKAGYRNLLAHDVFVYHSGGVSFDTTYLDTLSAIEKRLLGKHPDYLTRVSRYVEADPARDARFRLDLYRIARYLAQWKVAVFVTHNRGGGIATHVRDASERLAAEGVKTLILSIAGRRAIRLSVPPEQDLHLPEPSFEQLDLGRHADLLAAFLDWLDPALVHVHSFVGLDWPSTRRMIDIVSGTRNYYFTLHDYSAVCHRNDLVTPLAQYCGLPGSETCRACIAIDHQADDVPDPDERRGVYARFLSGAAGVLAPSGDIAERLRPFIPEARIVIRPHEERLTAAASPPAPRRVQAGAAGSILQIAAVGAIGPHKGSGVLHDLALDARLRNLPVQYRIIGYSDRTDRMAQVGVIETGAYKTDGEAMDLLRSLKIDLVMIPSIWPETYCYALSIALAAGVPPVAFDLGAQAERLRATGEGVLVPPSLLQDPSAFNDRLLATPLAEVYDRRRRYETFAYPSLVRAYYDAA
ncbi:glycosyltransferase [uncultured Methylobacterium sp.]|uniref:glycosyltransferase n=1 Tax=uncultured Methylobacterium sp. TaxID=157278 RepID=UPI00261FD20D|nr:glycosyltransferase [uncultured Methylobacterium sp.]